MVDLLGHIEMDRDTTKAIALYQLNAELYPGSPKAFRTLGEAWMAKGEVTQAIAAYQNAVALNPNDQHARDMIRKLQGGK
jgi:tetratricopeptide (TPR) repeat protein